MDAQQQHEFCHYTAEYVQAVAGYLGHYLGEGAAHDQVVQHLGLILESMFEGVHYEDMAWSLIPQPHNVPMPGVAA